MEEFDVKASSPIHVNNIFTNMAFENNESREGLIDVIQEEDNNKYDYKNTNSANNIMNFDDQDQYRYKQLTDDIRQSQNDFFDLKQKTSIPLSKQNSAIK